ncbi:hypothetical protein DGG96_03650 [Legionella qingyii]|uniref:Uncharacterized protein n=1 Tax=Legionella qingyii TaxID=2184757 RepID=A0A317U512_9GAMM|nr:hypothetical protein [Legionella qingyii]PWY57093.1 hypothetical protein DGG96_03650 [Legionella qingyii]
MTRTTEVISVSASENPREVPNFMRLQLRQQGGLQSTLKVVINAVVVANQVLVPEDLSSLTVIKLTNGRGISSHRSYSLIGIVTSYAALIKGFYFYFTVFGRFAEVHLKRTGTINSAIGHSKPIFVIDGVEVALH